MNKHELAGRLAKQSHRSRGEAADAVDKLVYGLLKDLQRSPEKPPRDEQIDLPKPPAAARAKGKS